MSERNQPKLNWLLSELGDAELVSARWLRAHGYSSSLVARYVRSGWLRSPARGVYAPARAGTLAWTGVLRSLQRREGLHLHAGGRFALAWQGHEHYLRLGESPTVTLYGKDRPPGWLSNLPMQATLQYLGVGPFPPTQLAFAEGSDDELLHRDGLLLLETSTNGETVVMSTPERAMLELCAGKANSGLVLEADAVMQSLVGLRRDLVQSLLGNCRSVQAKRLFLALAERHAHPWLARVDLHGMDLGSGNRVLVEGGRMNRKYQITLPRELEDALG